MSRGSTVNLLRRTSTASGERRTIAEELASLAELSGVLLQQLNATAEVKPEEFAPREKKYRVETKLGFTYVTLP